MGFMLDNLNYRNLAHAQQVETLKRVPAFHLPRHGSPAPGAGGADTKPSERIARLLASV
jgi:hypothetical protein